jgi:hypothetical protein
VIDADQERAAWNSLILARTKGKELTEKLMPSPWEAHQAGWAAGRAAEKAETLTTLEGIAIDLYPLVCKDVTSGECSHPSCIAFRAVMALVNWTPRATETRSAGNEDQEGGDLPPHATQPLSASLRGDLSEVPSGEKS